MVVFFLLAGATLISACAIYCHQWSSRLIEERRYVTVWIGVPILLLAALVIISAGMSIGEFALADRLLPQPYHDDFAPGPTGDGRLDGFVLLLFPFSALIALVYIFAALVRSLAKSPALPIDPDDWRDAQNFSRSPDAAQREVLRC